MRWRSYIDLYEKTETQTEAVLVEMSAPDAVRVWKQLGVDPTGLDDLGLKAAHRKLARTHHPDVGGNVEVAKLVNAAYDVLKKNVGNLGPASNPGSARAQSYYQDPVRRETEIWAQAGHSGGVPNSSNISRQDYTDVNFIKKRMWELSGKSKEVWNVCIYDGWFFRGAFSVFANESVFGLLGKAAAFWTQHGANSYGCKYVFVRPSQNKDLYRLIWANGESLKVPLDFDLDQIGDDELSMDANERMLIRAVDSRMGVKESLSEVELPDGWNLGGAWVDDRGHLHEIDHSRDVHHVDHALDEFGEHLDTDEHGEYDDYAREAALEMAMDQGWIRISTRTPTRNNPHSSINVEWHGTPSTDAFQTLLGYLRGKRFDVYFLQDRTLTRSQFLTQIKAHLPTNMRESLSEKHVGGLDYPVLENPSGPELIGFLNQCKRDHNEFQGRGLIDSTGNLYVWPAYRATHYSAQIALERAGIISGIRVAQLYFGREDDSLFSMLDHGYGPISVGVTDLSMKIIPAGGISPALDRLLVSLKRISETIVEARPSRYVRTTRKVKLPRVLYHGTRRELLPTIQHEGLRPDRSQSGDRGVYLAVDSNGAGMYPADVDDDERVILAIDMSRLNEHDLGPDLDDWYDDGSRTFKRISQSYDEDALLAYSLRVVGQILYRNTIPPSAITVYGGVKESLSESLSESEMPNWGWWVMPDGSVDEVSEMAGHGPWAHSALEGTPGYDNPEESYDVAIDELLLRGGVRLATYHGSREMDVDFRPDRITPRARSSLLQLLYQERDEIDGYMIGDSYFDNLARANQEINRLTGKLTEVLDKGKFAGIGRDEFLGRPRITSTANARDLRPTLLNSLRDVPREPFLTGYTAVFGEHGAAVFDGEKIIASYNFGDTLVVDRKYRRRGIGQELVYQWRTRYPGAKPASSRTKASQALQKKVWSRIEKELGEDIAQSIPSVFWWHVQNGIITVWSKGLGFDRLVHHTQTLIAEPERFGLDPAEAEASFRAGKRFHDPDLIRKAQARGWIRGRCQGTEFDLEGATFEHVRACALWIANQTVPTEIYIEAEGKNVVLKGNGLERFLKTGKIAWRNRPDPYKSLWEAYGGNTAKYWVRWDKDGADWHEVESEHAMDTPEVGFQQSLDRGWVRIGITHNYADQNEFVYAQGRRDAIRRVIRPILARFAVGEISIAFEDGPAHELVRLTPKGAEIFSRTGQVPQRELVEKQVQTGAEFPVLRNPTGAELIGFMQRCKTEYGHGEARGYLSGSGDVYVWPAFSAVHHTGRIYLVDAGLISGMYEEGALNLFFSPTANVDIESGWSEHLRPYGQVFASGANKDRRGISLRGKSSQMDMLLRGLGNPTQVRESRYSVRPWQEEKREPLDFDQLYGKAFRITDPSGNPEGKGFSIVTPENGQAWRTWKERPQFRETVRKRLNDPDFLADHKYAQIVRASKSLV